jgi:hypothetical protein
MNGVMQKGAAIAPIALALFAALSCKGKLDDTALVGVYTVDGRLTENTCGIQALPTPNPLKYRVEIREKDGVGYWVPDKQVRNLGSLNERGDFRFVLAQSQVYSNGTPTQIQQQPNDFIPPVLQAEPGQQPMAACVLTIKQTVSGSLRRRNAADGGGVIELPQAGDDDLIADNVIEVSPTIDSKCNPALAMLGGTYLTLPCSARYTMDGRLNGAEMAGAAGGLAAVSGSAGAAGAPTAGAAAP